MSIPTSFHAARELIRVKASGNEFIELVHEATNEEPWGPTGTQMDEVCRAFTRGSLDIMEEIKLRLKHRDKSWRPCYKSLLLLDHLARNVPESGLPAVCSVTPIIRTISQTFYYTGSKGTDHGLSVRERAKKLCDLLSDGAALREEREKAAVTRYKLSGASASGGTYGASRYQGYSSSFPPPPPVSRSNMSDLPSRPARTKEEQERYDMELAARMQREEESRTGISVVDAERMFNQQVRSQPPAVTQAVRNADLELARKLEEEEQRLRARREKETSSSTQSAPSAQPVKPTTTTTTTTTTSLPVTNAVTNSTSTKVEPPKNDVLDDLFAPPTTTSNFSSQQSGGWSAPASMQPQPSAPLTDPFDAFLDTRIKQQQQLYSQPQPQQYSGMSAGGSWYGGAQSQMSTPAQNMAWGGGAVAPALYGGGPSQGGWGGGQPQPQAQAQVPAFYQTPGGVSGGANFTGYAAPGSSSNNMSGVNNSNMMEQQMAFFSGQYTGQQQQQQQQQSLDALMAGRRTDQ